MLAGCACWIGMDGMRRLAVDLLRPVPGEAEYVLASWPIDRSGRKMSTGCALFSAQGELHAVARALWIEVSA